MINLNGKAQVVIHKFYNMWEQTGTDSDHEKYTKDEISNQRLQAVIAGSVRAPDRLFKAGLLTSPACPCCGRAEADLRHLLWSCPSWQAVRAPYLALIDKYRQHLEDKAHGMQRIEELNRLLDLPCVANCGVFPEAEYFRRGGSPIPPPRARFLARNSSPQELSPRQIDRLIKDQRGRAVVFTDGSAIHRQDKRRRRAAWSVYDAPEHPWNYEGPVHTESQTVYAAELMAVTHAVLSASMPTRIVSDCKAVVDCVREEIRGSDRATTGDDSDLRRQLRACIREVDQEYYEIEWINSHVDLEHAADIEARGGPPRQYYQGNAQADLSAKDAIRWHDLDLLEHGKAEDREFLATVVQPMLE